MKTINRTSVLLLSLFLALNVIAAKSVPGSMFLIHVVISTKSYWDGPTKSCLPREKGGCCHIWIEGMEPGPGGISGEMALGKGNVIKLTVSRNTGMTDDTYKKCFAEGKFILDGPITFEPGILTRLRADANYIIPAGTYPITINGDLITITFN
jgi:hypothetical protein